MKFTEIMTLVSKGFTFSQIKELNAMAAADVDNTVDNVDNPAPAQDPQPEPAQDPQPEPAQDPQPEPENETDYKKLYEDAMKELKEAQAANRRNAGADAQQKTDEELLQSIIDEF